MSCCRFSFPRAGPSCFKISGQVYHKFNTVAQPADHFTIPTNGQLYFYDPDEANAFRMQSYEELNPIILAHIDVALRSYYPFAEAYKMMKEIIQEQEYHMPGVSNVIMLIGMREGIDPNRYNIPRVNEVAAIMVGDCNGDIPPASILVQSKGTKELKNVYPLDPVVEPLLYPLYYPLGTRGWHYFLKDSTGKNISLCDFIKFKLFYRRNFFLPHHHSKKLFQ